MTVLHVLHGGSFNRGQVICMNLYFDTRQKFRFQNSSFAHLFTGQYNLELHFTMVRLNLRFEFLYQHSKGFETLVTAQ